MLLLILKNDYIYSIKLYYSPLNIIGSINFESFHQKYPKT